MSFYRFSSLGNQLRPTTQFHAFLPQGFHTNYRPSADIVDADGNKMQAVRQVTRKVSTAAPRQVSMPTAHAPTSGAMATSHGVAYPLLDINVDIPKEHLAAPYGDPNKMLGVGGKLIPKLPKGTRVGRFVMGDHGLYDPAIRAKKQKWWSASQAGVAPYNVSSSPALFYALGAIATYCVVKSFINIYAITTNTPPLHWKFLYPEDYKKALKK